jgi:hypothetical protein
MDFTGSSQPLQKSKAKSLSCSLRRRIGIGNKEIKWTVIDALEKAHVIKPIRRSSENDRTWIYALVNST